MIFRNLRYSNDLFSLLENVILLKILKREGSEKISTFTKTIMRFLIL